MLHLFPEACPQEIVLLVRPGTSIIFQQFVNTGLRSSLPKAVLRWALLLSTLVTATERKKAGVILVNKDLLFLLLLPPILRGTLQTENSLPNSQKVYRT